MTAYKLADIIAEITDPAVIRGEKVITLGGGLRDPRNTYYALYDTVRAPGATGPLLGLDVAGAGAASALSWSSAKGPGGGSVGSFYSLATGTATTGRNYWAAGASSIIEFDSDLESAYWRGMVRVPTLSTAGEEFGAVWGFNDSVIALNNTDGAVFRYDRLVSGANIQVQNRAAGVGAVTDGGIAVDTNWHEYIVRYIASPARAVQYWVDGVLIATVTTNVPSSGQGTGLGAGIIKSAGTTSRNLDIAFQEVLLTWTTARGLVLPF